MTDLISSLADQIIALINAKPASPRKSDIEAILQAVFVVDGQEMSLGYAAACVRWVERNRPKQVHAFDATGGEEASVEIRHPVMPMPYKDPSPRMMELMVKVRDDVREAMRIDQLAPALQSRWVPDTLRKARAKWLACPTSPTELRSLCSHYTNGHHYDAHCSDKHGMFYRCACGADRP